jgi:hypothetical protein
MFVKMKQIWKRKQIFVLKKKRLVKKKCIFLFCKDLVTLTFQIMCGKITENLVFESLLWKVIFIEGEGDEIKSKQASKRNRTLPLVFETSANFHVTWTSVSVLFPLSPYDVFFFQEILIFSGCDLLNCHYLWNNHHLGCSAPI